MEVEYGCGCVVKGGAGCRISSGDLRHLPAAEIEPLPPEPERVREFTVHVTDLNPSPNDRYGYMAVHPVAACEKRLREAELGDTWHYAANGDRCRRCYDADAVDRLLGRKT